MVVVVGEARVGKLRATRTFLLSLGDCRSGGVVFSGKRTLAALHGRVRAYNRMMLCCGCSLL